MNKKSPLSLSPSNQKKLEDYLEVAPQFRLGKLVTETPHPDTKNLSHLANHDLQAAISCIKRVDIRSMETLFKHLDELNDLQQTLLETLQKGDRIFLCGCGATGRLVLSLEYFWRESFKTTRDSFHPDQVIAFMAGGDTALIKSIENFEDHPEFGARQLMELGFRKGDLLISCTEGGETAFVIGATNKAREVSQSPFFIYGNPDELLDEIKRSKEVLDDSNIKKINLTTGPMILAGSTRLQSCTTQMLAVGSCLFSLPAEQSIKQLIQSFISFIQSANFNFLTPFIKREAECYLNKKQMLYQTSDFGITIMTDTTERAPTFSLSPFENFKDAKVNPSWCYLHLENTVHSEQAWQKLLCRPPRSLNWAEYSPFTDISYLYGFDFSDQGQRSEQNEKQQIFRIDRRDNKLHFQLADLLAEVQLPGEPLLFNHLFLKIILNIHSTLVMGKMGRFQNNIMTYVRPSNFKLIDRAIRYIRFLLQQKGEESTYEEVAAACFSLMDELDEDESIVLKVLHTLKK